MQTTGKNKRRQFEVYDNVHSCTLSVDSSEEVDFIEWLNEAYELSIIDDFQYQPESFMLFENVKYVDVYGKTKSLFQEHVYSCDFKIMFDANKFKELAKELKVPNEQLSSTQVSAYIDTKGMFNRNSRSFTTDRKWVWDRYHVYIAEIIPNKFFAKFGVPIKCFLSKKTKKPRKIFNGMMSIKQAFQIEK